MVSKGINYATHKLRQELVEVINVSGLPPCNVRAIVADIYNQCIAQENEAIEKERNDYESALKNESKNAEVVNSGNDN